MAQGDYSFSFHETTCRIQGLFQSFQCHINKTRLYTPHRLLFHKETDTSYLQVALRTLQHNGTSPLPQERAGRVRTREPERTRAFTPASFCSGPCSLKATTSAVTMYLRAPRTRVRAVGPACIFRKTCTDPVAVLGFRKRQERSQGTAAPRPRILRGLRRARPGRHQGHSFIITISFFFRCQWKPVAADCQVFVLFLRFLFVCGFFPCPPQHSARAASPSAAGAAARPSRGRYRMAALTPPPLRPAGLPQPLPARCLHF